MAIYKFVEHHNICYDINVAIDFQNEWLLIRNGIAVVKGSYKKGYAWNGCSPKFNIWDLTFGTPDGRTDMKTEKSITYYASMIHDCLYQFGKEMGLKRVIADNLLKTELKKAGFKLWFVYWFAVRLLGWIFW
jgi:hypothetical protein